MALPVVKKPLETSYLVMPNKYGSQGRYYEKYVQRWTQAEPIDRPLSYWMAERTSRFVRNDDNANVSQILTPDATAVAAASDRAYSKAYAKFREKVLQGERAELGINLATAGQTADLLDGFLKNWRSFDKIAAIVKNLNAFGEQMSHAAAAKKRSARRAYRRKGARYLSSTRVPSDAEVSRLRRNAFRTGGNAFASEYLAFHFALSPLIGDLFTLLKQLQEGYTNSPVFIKAGSHQSFSHRATVMLNTIPYTGQVARHTDSTGRVGWTMGCEAIVSNDVLFVMNRTGLINPATVAFDVVPFSFVLDWFGNFSQMFAAPTDFFGVSLSDYYETRYIESKVKRSNPKVSSSSTAQELVTEGWEVTRTTKTLPSFPRLALKNPISSSWRRGLAQISLLTVLGVRAKLPHSQNVF